eukprot:GGOE01013690.1.p1 GENE.GGOE01013690.1~~GGOE01013690.1.p1  ORF type:complete len:378 (+),score=41.74 GGOE01013690.1:53-1135(+)
MVEFTGIWRIPGICAWWKIFSWPFHQMITLAKYLGLDAVFGIGAPKPFWEYFHEKYVAQDPNAPGLPFFEGSFNEAAEEAKRQFRFLLVYLHSEQHHNTAHFCRGTLQKPAVLHVLLDNFVLWGANVLDSEGYYYSHTLQACGFPFLGVIATIDGQKQLVMRMEGDLTEEVLISKLEDCVENVGPSLIAARLEAEARVANDRLRQEQDRAYEEAQRRDRERLLERRRQEEEEERARWAAEEAKHQAELEVQKEETRRQQHAACVEAQRAAKMASLSMEPPNGPDVTTLRITMFDGSHFTRRFKMDNKLQEVHDFIMAQQGWNGQDFVLTTNPVRLLDLHMTLRDEGLFPRAVVIAKEADN